MSFILIGKSSSLAKYLQHKLKINKIAVMSKRKAPSSSDNPNHKLCNVLTGKTNLSLLLQITCVNMRG